MKIVADTSFHAQRRKSNMHHLALALTLIFLLLSPGYPAAAQPRRADPPEGSAAAGARLVVFEVFMTFG